MPLLPTIIEAAAIIKVNDGATFGLKFGVLAVFFIIFVLWFDFSTLRSAEFGSSKCLRNWHLQFSFPCWYSPSLLRIALARPWAAHHA